MSKIENSMSQEERLKLLERACGLLNLKLERDSMSNWRIIDCKSINVWLDDQAIFNSFDSIFKKFLKTKVFWCSFHWEITFPAEISLTENKVYGRQSAMPDVEVETDIAVDLNNIVNQFSNPFYGMTEEEFAVKIDLDSSTASENRV